MHPSAKELCKEIRQLGHVYESHQVFSDFVELVAIEISVTVDPVTAKEREERYKQVAQRYKKLEERQQFYKMFQLLYEAMQDAAESGHYEDVLGDVFHELELYNKWKAQYFTPACVAEMMAEIVFSPDELMLRQIAEKGFVAPKISETCCGSGVMMLGFANVLLKAKFNPAVNMVPLLVDVDLKCAQMAYIQMSLYGIPAVVIHGDALLVKEFSRWYTPIYIMGKWLWRQPLGLTTGRNWHDEALKCLDEPMYAAIRKLEALESTDHEADAPAERPDEAREKSANPNITLSEQGAEQISLFDQGA